MCILYLYLHLRCYFDIFGVEQWLTCRKARLPKVERDAVPVELATCTYVAKVVPQGSYGYVLGESAQGWDGLLPLAFNGVSQMKGEVNAM